jgi:hypothetical protein
MASIQNITFEDQGNNWRVAFEHSEDNGVLIPWQLFEARFPADFGDINPDDVEGAMLELGMAVARGQGIDL